MDDFDDLYSAYKDAEMEQEAERESPEMEEAINS